MCLESTYCLGCLRTSPACLADLIRDDSRILYNNHWAALSNRQRAGGGPVARRFLPHLIVCGEDDEMARLNEISLVVVGVCPKVTAWRSMPLKYSSADHGRWYPSGRLLGVPPRSASSGCFVRAFLRVTGEDGCGVSGDDICSVWSTVRSDRLCGDIRDEFGSVCQGDILSSRLCAC